MPCLVVQLSSLIPRICNFQLLDHAKLKRRKVFVFLVVEPWGISHIFFYSMPIVLKSPKTDFVPNVSLV